MVVYYLLFLLSFVSLFFFFLTEDITGTWIVCVKCVSFLWSFPLFSECQLYLFSLLGADDWLFFVPGPAFFDVFFKFLQPFLLNYTTPICSGFPFPFFLDLWLPTVIFFTVKFCLQVRDPRLVLILQQSPYQRWRKQKYDVYVVYLICLFYLLLLFMLLLCKHNIRLQLAARYQCLLVSLWFVVNCIVIHANP